MNTSTSKTSTRSLESQLFRAFWDDGLLDLLFGVGALGVGVAWAAGMVALGAIVPALLAIAWNPLRRAIVEPRSGWVEFNRARSGSNRRKLHGALWLGVGALVLAAALAIATRAGGDLVPGDLAAALPAALIGLLAGLVGAGLRIGRFLAYALLFVLAGAVVALAGGEPELAMLAGGAAVTVSGSWILARFVRATARVDQG